MEVDKDNEKKGIDALDLEIPVLTPRVYREYKNLTDLDASTMTFQTVAYQQFTGEEQREIVFKDILTTAQEIRAQCGKPIKKPIKKKLPEPRKRKSPHARQDSQHG